MIPLVSVVWGLSVVGGIRGWRQENDAVASEPSIFSENHDYKSFYRVTVNTYVPIFQGLDARGGRKLQTDIHTHIHTHTYTHIHTHTYTHTHGTTTVTLAACRGFIT